MYSYFQHAIRMHLKAFMARNYIDLKDFLLDASDFNIKKKGEVNNVSAAVSVVREMGGSELKRAPLC